AKGRVRRAEAVPVGDEQGVGWHRAAPGSATRVGNSAAISTASDVPGCVLVLERAHGYSFVLRPCQMTPLARRNHQRTPDTDHYGSVMAPRSAPVTRRAYLASTP